MDWKFIITIVIVAVALISVTTILDGMLISEDTIAKVPVLQKTAITTPLKSSSSSPTTSSTFEATSLGISIKVMECMNLTIPNKVYQLTQNISGTQSGRDVCIDIQADNITFYGGGHVISRTGGKLGYGVFSENDGITIKNVGIKGYSTDIFLNASSDDLVEGCNVSNSIQGILVQYSDNVSISNINASFNTVGVSLDHTINLSIINNSLEGNVNQGIYISHSLNTTINNNFIFNSDGIGIHVDSSKVKILTNSMQNMPGGIYLLANTLGEVSNNTLLNVNDKAIVVDDFLGEVIHNSIKNSSCGIYVGSSDDNISYNYLENNTIGIQFILSHNNHIEGNTYVMNVAGVYLHGLNSSNFSNEVYTNNNWDIYADQSYGNIMENESINGTIISFKFFDVLINSSLPAEQVDDGYVDLHKYIRITNLSSDSWVDLNISYSDTEVKQYNLDESTIRLWRFNGTWQPPEKAAVVNDVNTAANYVYSKINTFSIFTLVGLKKTEEGPLSVSHISIEPPLICSNGIAYYYFHRLYPFETEKTEDKFCNDLRIVSITPNRNVYQAKIDISEINSTTSVSNIPYKYFGVDLANINSSYLDNVTLMLRVNKSWVDKNGIAPSTVKIYYYNNGWKGLNTKLTYDDSTYYYFTATTDKLYTFAASGEQGVDFWVVFGNIQKYYSGEISFTDVINVIDKYYT